MNKVSIKGVVAGILTAQVIGLILAVALTVIDRMMPIHLDPNNIFASLQPSLTFKLIAYFSGLFSVFIGGYVAAFVAKRNELVNAILASILSLGNSIYVWYIGITPLWLLLVSLVAGIFFSGLGGYVRLRQMEIKSLTNHSSGTPNGAP